MVAASPRAGGGDECADFQNRGSFFQLFSGHADIFTDAYPGFDFYLAFRFLAVLSHHHRFHPVGYGGAGEDLYALTAFATN